MSYATNQLVEYMVELAKRGAQFQVCAGTQVWTCRQAGVTPEMPGVVSLDLVNDRAALVDISSIYAVIEAHGDEGTLSVAAL